jgi:hypothetical protein
MREELAVAHGVLAAGLVVLRLTLHFVTLGDGGGALALFQVPRVRARVRHRKLLHVRLRTSNDVKVFDAECKRTQRCRLPQRSRVNKRLHL